MRNQMFLCMQCMGLCLEMDVEPKRILWVKTSTTWQYHGQFLLQLTWSGRQIKLHLLQATERKLVFTGAGLDDLQRSLPTSTFL